MATFISEQDIEIIDTVFTFWIRTILSDAHISFDDLLKVIHRYYTITEETVSLVVIKHSRCVFDCHPSNLLDGDGLSYYQSMPNWSCSSVHLDWIIFEQKEQRRFAPTKVMIGNTGYHDYQAIKSVSIQWSADGLEYQDLIQINDIQLNSEKQWFELKTEQIIFMKFMKLIILENYGDPDDTVFREFGVVGVLD